MLRIAGVDTGTVLVVGLVVIAAVIQHPVVQLRVPVSGCGFEVIVPVGRIDKHGIDIEVAPTPGKLALGRIGRLARLLSDTAIESDLLRPEPLGGQEIPPRRAGAHRRDDVGADHRWYPCASR